MSGVDSCYSWVVASASSLIFLLVSCPVRLGAQLFVSLLDRYDANRTEASFPFALALIVRSVSGLFAGVLGEMFGLQRVTIIGCFLCTLGVCGCFFAENVLTINICLGLIYGMGFALSNAVIPEILNRHFKRHRSKAYGLFLSGSGFGSFLVPPVLDLILKKFGTSGSFLIMGGTILNSVPAAMLLTVPNTEKKRDRTLPVPNTSHRNKTEYSRYDFTSANIAVNNSIKEASKNVPEVLKLPIGVLSNNYEISEIQLENDKGEQVMENHITVLKKSTQQTVAQNNRHFAIKSDETEQNSIYDLKAAPVQTTNESTSKAAPRERRVQDEGAKGKNTSYEDRPKPGPKVANLRIDKTSNHQTSNEMSETQLQNGEMEQAVKNDVTATIRSDKDILTSANRSISYLNEETEQKSVYDLKAAPVRTTNESRSKVAPHERRVQDDGEKSKNISYENRPKTGPKVANLHIDKTSNHQTSKEISETQLQNGEMEQAAKNNVAATIRSDKYVPAKADKSISYLNEETQQNSSYELKAVPFNKRRIQDESISNNTKINSLKDASLNSKKPLLEMLEVLWSPVFLTIASYVGFVGFMNQVFWTITVDFVRDKGIEQYLEVYFVMSLSLSDTLGRLLLGSIIDKGWTTIANFTISCCVVTGLVFVSILWLSEFFSMMAAFSLMGLTFGGCSVAMPSLITEFIGKEKRAIAMASRQLLMAPMSFTVSPLIGFFRGSLGSYDGLLYLMSFMCIFCVILVLLLPVLAKRRDHVKIKETT